MLKATYDVNNNGIVDNAEKVNNHTVEKDVPANAVFTDTTYSEATTSQAGLMSSTDKSNLDSNTSARHTHSNKSTLDGISSSDISNWNGKQNATDNSLTTTNKTITPAINEVNSIAKGANQALSYANYQAMITAFNSLDDDEYNVGQNIYIVTTEVPDLWISSVESTSSTYTYVDDATFVNSLATNGYVQVGYYKLSMLETQKVDLTDYVTNTDYAGSNKVGVIRTNTDYGTSITSVGALISATKTYQQYLDAATNNMFISKGTLENAITGKGLVSNTDYATASVGGVVKVNTSYGFNMSNGYLTGNTKTYAQYGDANTGIVVSKGTLENVITGKGLVSNTDYASSSTAGVVKANAAFGTQMGNEGLLYGAIRTYEQYNSAGNNALISKGTLENVITGKSLETANNKVTSISSTSTNTQYPGAKAVYDFAQSIASIGGDTLPIGAIIPFSSDTIPENWLLCDGQAVSRTTYQELFNTIGITYGSGDGFTTFNLPDLQGKIPVGLDENDTDFNTLGNTGGEKEHTLTVEEIPPHNHTIKNGTNGNDGGSDWAVSNTGASNWKTANTGGGQPHNILQPYIVQNYIIKAKQSAGVVATVVDGLNSTSATDALSANQGNVLKGETIYENLTGANNNITLSKSIANFTFIEVYYSVSIENYTINDSKKSQATDNMDISLSCEIAHSDIMQIFDVGRWHVSGTSISKVYETDGRITSSGYSWTGSVNRILIKKIVGYNY